MEELLTNHSMPLICIFNLSLQRQQINTST